MRGYVSFVLVFSSALLLSSLILLYDSSGRADLSKAVTAERAYGIQMNAKEAAIESVRGGAESGFSAYDTVHSLENCTHCTDHGCAPLSDPPPPNYCSEALCDGCFRESGAREAALSSAQARLSALRGHEFDRDFNVSIGNAELEAFLAPDGTAKNGFALSGVRFRRALQIDVQSGKFGIFAAGKIPQGVTLE
ncbi:MAG: hypothetical protein AB1324_00830 [Candidatus Micrarchaeota archaeon]